MSRGSSPWMTTELMKTERGWPRACWTSWTTKVPGATSVGSCRQVGSDKAMDMVPPLPLRAASWSGEVAVTSTMSVLFGLRLGGSNCDTNAGRPHRGKPPLAPLILRRLRAEVVVGRQRDGLGSAAHAELGEDGADVMLSGLGGSLEPRREPGVAQALTK